MGWLDQAAMNPIVEAEVSQGQGLECWAGGQQAWLLKLALDLPRDLGSLP